MIRQLRDEFPQSPMPMVIEAYYYAAAGEQTKASEILNTLDAAELPPVTELMRASIYVALERESEAVQLLLSARDKRLLSLPLTAIHPTHDPLRNRPDYQSLLTDLGLKEQGARRLTMGTTKPDK